MQKTVKEIIKSLQRNNRNCAKAALELGIHRATTYRWRKKGTSLYGNLQWQMLHKKSTRPNKLKSALSLQDQFDIIRVRNGTGYAAAKLKEN